jgi:hypothetical protein
MVALVLLLVCGGVGAIGYIAIGRVRTAAQEVQRIQAENLRAIEEQNRRAQEAMQRAQQQQTSPRSSPPVPSPSSNTPLTNQHAPSHPAAPPPPETPAEKHARYLRWLTSNNGGQIKEAAEWFAVQTGAADPPKQRAVADALCTALGDGRAHQAPQLLAALAVWGDGQCFEPVLGVAEHHRDHAATAIELIGRWKNVQSIDGLIALLERKPEQLPHIQPVLVSFGDEAEAKLLPHMNHEQNQTRDNVRAILGALEVSSATLAAQAIADTTAEAARQRQAAITWLASAELEEAQREAATKAIGARLDDDDRDVKDAARAALLADESPASTEILLPLLAKQEHGWNKVLESLLARGEMRAAEPLGALVSEPLSMGQALQAIRTTSGPGEDVVLHLITTTKDEQLIYHVCFALGKSGTEKSLKVLEQLARKYQSNMGMMIAINHAAKEIQQREGQK